MWTEFYPDTIPTDYEQTAIALARETFLQAQIHGCFLSLTGHLIEKTWEN